VKFLIFYKKFYKVHNIEVLNQDPVNKKNFSLFIIPNMEFRFEPCVLNLIWELQKIQIKEKDHLIFINFGVKKFTLENIKKKQNFGV
jgi:hypothetical protein